MIKYWFLIIPFFFTPSYAQKALTIEKDLHGDWMKFQNGVYQPLHDDVEANNTIYFKIDLSRYPGSFLSVQSSRSFFIFCNGKISGEHSGKGLFRLDSLSTLFNSPVVFIAVHQPRINPRDLKTLIVSHNAPVAPARVLSRPSTYFRDFVITAGLIIILLFLFTMKLNPKLGSDYFSPDKIFSLREGDEQSNVRLTSSSNIQFYVISSLLLGFYIMIILNHLPDAYALPLFFQSNSFGSVVWQWLRLSTIVLGIFFLKIILIFSLTRLFGLRGMTRVHFFNWVRLLLIVIGCSSVILFVYFIWRGQSTVFYVVFLSLVIGTLTAWIFIVFLKLSSKSEHSMFHLFSYICATELIPLLITIKILFQ